VDDVGSLGPAWQAARQRKTTKEARAFLMYVLA
jgi:hypothetical protein